MKQDKKKRRAGKAKAKAKAAALPPAEEEKDETVEETEKGEAKMVGKSDDKEPEEKHMEKDGKEKEDTGKEKKAIRPPSEKLTSWAFDKLTEAKGDDATWFHVKKLFEGVTLEERACLEKWIYWALSMYWNTHRVGVLQKQTGGGSKHVLSFGGGHCKHIGIPFVASQLFVCCLIALTSTFN